MSILQNEILKKKWSEYVTRHSNALDLEEGVFRWDDPKEIAKSLKRSAMSMLNFYINRAGKNLSPGRKKILEKAKTELRKIFI